MPPIELLEQPQNLDETANAPLLPPPGLAAHRRRAREAKGDFRSGSDVLAEETLAEEEARNIALWGRERGEALNRQQAALRAEGEKAE